MNENILLITNNNALMSDLILALSRAGFVIDVVSHYPENTQKPDESNPDLVIVDGISPVVDGVEALYRIRNSFDTPILLLGDDSSDEVWAKVMEADIDSYEIKPLRLTVLVARVKALLRRHKKACRSADLQPGLMVLSHDHK